MCVCACGLIAAVSLACNARISVRWITSEFNPSDRLSRRFQTPSADFEKVLNRSLVASIAVTTAKKEELPRFELPTLGVAIFYTDH